MGLGWFWGINWPLSTTKSFLRPAEFLEPSRAEDLPHIQPWICGWCFYSCRCALCLLVLGCLNSASWHWACCRCLLVLGGVTLAVVGAAVVGVVVVPSKCATRSSRQCRWISGSAKRSPRLAKFWGMWRNSGTPRKTSRFTTTQHEMWSRTKPWSISWTLRTFLALQKKRSLQTRWHPFRARPTSLREMSSLTHV